MLLFILVALFFSSLTNIKSKIEAIAFDAIANKVFPGCVIGVAYKSGERFVLPCGNFTYEASSEKVKEDTIYDLASVTKSIPVSSLALKLIDEGKLKLDDKLIDYVPQLRNKEREAVLVKHLLTNTIGGYGLCSTIMKSRNKSIEEIRGEDILNLLFEEEFSFPTGSAFKYYNLGALFLGLIIEKIEGKNIALLGDEYFFKPMAMTRTTFYPEQFPLTEIAPTEIDDWRGLVRGMPHDEATYIFKQDNKVMGSAGLFSTAGDILNFLEMLLHYGVYKDKRYFSKEIIEQFSTNQISELGDYTGLGWELNQERFMGKYCTPHTFGKTGFTGTLCVCDINLGVAYTILSNRTFPKRPINADKINEFRRSVGDIVFQSIDKYIWGSRRLNQSKEKL